MALLAHSDCLVSLHRSEGLGLHLAEAMWLGTPVIATAYSGNLDLMDDRSAALVGYELVAVGAAGQGVYPPTARWAQPDVGEAAELMRRMVSDATWREGLAAAALQRMEQTSHHRRNRRGADRRAVGHHRFQQAGCGADERSPTTRAGSVRGNRPSTQAMQSLTLEVRASQQRVDQLDRGTDELRKVLNY